MISVTLKIIIIFRRIYASIYTSTRLTYENEYLDRILDLDTQIR